MKIGLLLPNSKYYPFIGSDLYMGFKHYLGGSHQYIIRDIGVGSPKECLQAVKELALYEGVDLLVGFAGYRSVTAIKPLVQQTKTPMILCSSGEHPLLKTDVSPYIVHLSLGLFQSIYLACKWAFLNIGRNYSYTGSFFEAGYPILFAADAAAKQYNGAIVHVSTTHKDRDPAIEQACKQLTEKNNDFIFMGYHGKDAIEMARYLDEKNSFGNKPLVVSPFFYEPEILGTDIDYPVLTVKSWKQISAELNSLFESEYERNATIFATLGYEAAQLVINCTGAGWKRKEALASYANENVICSERGTLNFDPQMNCFINNYYLLATNSNKNEKMKSVCNGDILIPDNTDNQILNGFDLELSGWLNTYLCN